jgi:hypothetical protein
MGRLGVTGTELVLDLSGLEKVEGFHGDIHVPVSAVRDIRCVQDPWSELRGIRAPGTGVPGVVAVGTRRGSDIKDFAVVHGSGPAIVVDLAGAEYDRLVVTEDDAERAARELRRQVGLG